jgi:hypothetical protein
VYVKEYGGLCIPNLRDLSICLLGPWVKRHVHGGLKIWKTILDQKKITCTKTFSAVIHLELPSFGRE